MTSEHDTAPPSRQSILVVEDNSASERIAVLMLERLGRQCDVCRNGRDAIAAAVARRYDLVLMDIQLPDMLGYEAAREIRLGEPEGVRTPIVAMSAGVIQEERECCAKAGMDGYLAKPISLDTLREMLARHLCIRPPDKSCIAQTDSHAPVDMERIRHAANGDIALERELVELYLADTETRLDAIEHALVAQDFETARREIHSIKGASGSVGAKDMYQFTLFVEDLEDTELRDTTHPALQALNIAFARTREFLLDYIDEREAEGAQAPQVSTENVFAYGTLLDGAVQAALFGRILDGAADTLTGYTRTSVTQDGEAFPNLAPDRDGRVEGVLLELTSHELAKADVYEGEAYSRRKILTDSGQTAWIYVATPPGC